MSGGSDAGEVSSMTEDQNAISEWNDLTVAQLKEELQERGLETTGRKAELVARLVTSDKELMNKMGDEDHPAGNGETQGEGEESEFVVWNDGEEHDADKLLSEGGAGGGGEGQGEGGAEEEKKEDEKEILEGLKADDFDKDVEYHAKVAMNKDILLMTWRHHRIKVPFKEEFNREMKLFTKKQNIMMYPVELSDVYSDVFRRHIEVAVNVSMELDEMIPGSPPKGYLRLKFGSVAEAESAMDEIVEHRKQQEREISLKTFSDNDSEGEVLSAVKKEDASKRDPLLHRMLFVANLPSEVTEAALKDHFIGVLRVYLSRTEDAQDHNGYAYLEYHTEVEATQMAAQYKDTELYGQTLYVIKCLTQRRASFGLLKDSLRKYWLEQLANLEATKAKNVTRTPREISELDAKLLRLKRRIDKDNAVRDGINLPVPESERFGTTDADSEHDKSKEEKEKRTERSEERRAVTSPRRRHSPARTRGSSYRGAANPRYVGRGGGYSRGGGRDNTNVLVNQLQELVGVLATRVPEAAGAIRSAPGGGGGGGYSRGPSHHSSESYGGYRGGSSRYQSSGKRLHEEDYHHMDRKRRMDDDYYGSRDRGGYGGYGGSSRRGGGGYY